MKRLELRILPTVTQPLLVDILKYYNDTNKYVSTVVASRESRYKSGGLMVPPKKYPALVEFIWLSYVTHIVVFPLTNGVTVYINLTDSATKADIESIISLLKGGGVREALITYTLPLQIIGKSVILSPQI